MIKVPQHYVRARSRSMGTFNTISRWNKVWILATAVSWMLFGLYWVQMIYNRIPYLLETDPNRYLTLQFWTDHVTGGIVDTLRVVAVILIFVALYLAWGPKKQSFYAVKKYLSTAILFEGIFWLAVLPDIVRRLVTGLQPQLLYVGFLFEILGASVLLIVLAAKVWKYKVSSRNNLIKWGCFAGISYIFAMWIYNMFRWLSMSGLVGEVDSRLAINLFGGISSIGFLNTAITLTLSLVFAICASYLLVKRKNKKLRTQFTGLAIFLFGLHFIIYMIYAWFSPNEWAFVLVLTQIWPMPMIGVGIGLLLRKDEL
jgi:hypothetical protein